jgi:hypothetical protein
MIKSTLARIAQNEDLNFVFAPAGFDLCDNVVQGSVIRMGQPLLRLP